MFASRTAAKARIGVTDRLNAPDQRFDLFFHERGGKMQAAAVARQHPFEPVVEQLAQRLLLLGPGIPGDVATHLQPALPGPEMIAREQISVVDQQRAAPAGVARQVDDAQPGPQLAVAVEQDFRVDHRVVAMDDALAPEALPEPGVVRSEEHTSELQSRLHLVCRLLLEKKKRKQRHNASKTRA